MENVNERYFDKKYLVVFGFFWFFFFVICAVFPPLIVTCLVHLESVLQFLFVCLVGWFFVCLFFICFCCLLFLFLFSFYFVFVFVLFFLFFFFRVTPCLGHVQCSIHSLLIIECLVHLESVLQ